MWKFSTTERQRTALSSCLVMVYMPSFSVGILCILFKCGVLHRLFLLRSFHNLLLNERKRLHTFLYTNSSHMESVGTQNTVCYEKAMFSFVVLAMTLASCSTSQFYVTELIDYMESSARVLEAEHTLLSTPLIADVEVSDKKITYTEKEMFANLEVNNKRIDEMPELKKIALSRAAQAHNADILVGTTIDVVTKDDRLEITVTGYPARYVKFRNVSEQDIKVMEKLHLLRAGKGNAVDEIIASPEKKLNVTTTKVE